MEKEFLFAGLVYGTVLFSNVLLLRFVYLFTRFCTQGNRGVFFPDFGSIFVVSCKYLRILNKVVYTSCYDFIYIPVKRLNKCFW